MEPRDAIEILLNLRNKYPLDTDEQAAMLLAIGVLDSAALSKNRIKGILHKRKNKDYFYDVKNKISLKYKEKAPIKD